MVGGRKLYCQYCGTENKDNSKFCKNCGKLLYNFEEEETVENDFSGTTKKKNKILLGCSLIFVVILLVTASILMLWKRAKTMEEGRERKKNDTQEYVTSEEKAQEDTEKEKKTSQKEEVKNTLIKNPAEFVDYSNCLLPEKYEYLESPEGDYSFRYPNDIYYQGYWAGNNCYLEGKDGISGLEVVREECESSDAFVNMENMYKKYGNLLYEKEDILVSKEINQDGFARCILGGYLDKEKTISNYIIAASNGKHNYILTMEILKTEEADISKEANYVIDCVYRYCSFSGSSYKPRTYEQYLNDDMGEKKGDTTQSKKTVDESTVNVISPEDMEMMIAVIREKYKLVNDEVLAERADVEESYSGALGYYVDGTLSMIELKPSVTGDEFTREFYFDEDNSLYFAFYYNHGWEQRLYFAQGQMFAWINEDKEMYTYEDANESFQDYYEDVIDYFDYYVAEF